MKLIILLVVFIIPGFYSHSQTPSISDDTVLLKLTITDFEDKKMETLVQFYNQANHQQTSCKTSKEGKAECKLPVAATYTVKITGSTDSYEYAIPEFAASPTEVNFKFHLNNNVPEKPAPKAMAAEKLQTMIGIRVINAGDLKTITVSTANNSGQPVAIANDTAFFLLDQENNYTLTAKGISIEHNKIAVNKDDNLNYALFFTDKTHAALIPLNEKQALLNIVHRNLSEAPVPNETIIIQSEKSKKRYELTTSSSGITMALVPLNDHYSISLKHFPNAFELDVKPGKNPHAIVTNNIHLNYPGSKEYEVQLRDDSLAIVKRDSIYLATGKSKELSLKDFEAANAKQTGSDFEEVKKDHRYFEKKNNTVCAVLYRNKAKWESKIITTDVTGSMYPYMQQVELWHLLEAMDKKRSDYVFFNDGNRTPDYMKEIGKTGGIFFCLKHHLDSMPTVMFRAMQGGNGGDAPENDIEALISASSVAPAGTELILVADNLSPVKDISLLTNINRPVRVILCGMNGWVNPDYLLIAYKTKGSIHTIEEDIYNLSMLNEGETTIIKGSIYKFSGGRFFLLEKKL
jgi:hypothetical protein